MNVYAYVENGPVNLFDGTGWEAVFAADPENDFGGDFVDIRSDEVTPRQIVIAVAVTAAVAASPLAIKAGTAVVSSQFFLTTVRSLFGKGGVLNRGRLLRIGVGRKGGDSVIRIAGDLIKLVKKSGKIDLINRGQIGKTGGGEKSRGGKDECR